MTVLAKATVLVVLLVEVTIGAEALQDIPEFLHICQVQQPQYETCITNSINDLKPYLKVGVPEYHIPSLEPLKLKTISASPSNSLTMHANDINVYGASNFEINKIKMDLTNIVFNVDVALSNIAIDGKYEVDGKILLLPIHGSGPLSGNFSECIGACKIKGERFFDENGVEKIRIIDFRMKISVGKGSIKLDNLFDGEQVLGDVVNSAINNNFQLFMREFSPLLEMALSDAFQDIADKIIQQFSFSQLFPGA